MKQVEELHIQIEELRTTIKNVLDERLIELTDEGYSSKFFVSFTEYDRLGKNGITPYYIKKINFFDEFTISLSDRCKLNNFFGWAKNKIDEHIRVLTEFLLTIKDVGEYFGYDVIVYNHIYFTFKKKQVL
jgi:hypothetical protein